MKESQTIYYLDNDNEDLYFFKHAIEGLGHEISIFRDGHKMMQDLIKSETKPNIFFLGSNMPVLNGKELNVILNSSIRWNDVPIVIISGAFPKKLLRHYMESGVKLIMKRTHPADYSTTFKAVLEMKFA